MSVTVRIPSLLRSLTGGEREVVVEAATVRDALAAVEALHPGVRARIVDDDGQVRHFVLLLLADQDIRFLDGLDTAVGNDETLSVVPAISGG